MHHVYHGTASRKNADRYGLVVALCPYHHQFLHGRDGHLLDQALKMATQKYFEENIGDRELFRKEFGKSYL